MKISISGREYEADSLGKATLLDTLEMKKQTGMSLGDLETKFHIRLLRVGKFRAERKAGLRHQRREPGRGRDEFHAFFFQFIGDGAKNRMGILLPQAQQHAHRAEVGAEVEKVFGRHLAGHDALPHTASGEGGNHFSELADLEPDDVIHKLGERGVGLVLERHGDESSNTRRARGLRELQRERAVAGNDAERFDV